MTKAVLSGIHSDTCLPQKKKKSKKERKEKQNSNKQPNLPPKRIRKKEE